MMECVRCGVLDCSRCMFQSPRGMRCAYCACRSKPAVFEAGIKKYVAAFAATMALGGFLGAVFAMMMENNRWIPFLPLILAAVVGFIIGSMVSIATNGKRSLGLSLVATSGVLTAYLAAAAIPVFRPPGGWHYTYIDAGFALLYLALSLYIARSRVR